MFVSYYLCFFGGEFLGSDDGIDRKDGAVRRCLFCDLWQLRRLIKGEDLLHLLLYYARFSIEAS